MKAVGVMGGTFDPIHYGHLAVAEEARVAFGLSGVTFVPAGQPPHKEGRVEAPAEDRYAMTVLATADHPDFTVSRWELDAAGPSYTLETLKHFRRSDEQLFFIMGSDTLLEMRTWHAWAELGEFCEFIVATRPGFVLEERDWRELVPKPIQKRLHFLDGPKLAITATGIRERLRAKKSVRYLLPESVKQYIISRELYGLVRGS